MKINRRSLVIIFSLAVMEPCLAFGSGQPDWIDGPDPAYPARSYLTAVGFGDNRQSAENSAYGALARTFRAEIQSATHEAEQFSQREGRGNTPQTDRFVDLKNQTVVSTDVNLEQVQILAHWINSDSKVHYALAGIDRKKVSKSLRQQILERVSDVESWVNRAKDAKEPLLRVRALYQAVKTSKQVDEYRNYLRVIDSDPVSLNENPTTTMTLQGQLNDLLRQHFQVGIELTGVHADEVETAMLEGLNRRGLISGPKAKLLINGVIRFEKTGPKSPTWHFIRWNARIILMEKESGEIFGTIRRTGREGQLSPEAAEEKALMMLLDEVDQEIGKMVAEFIFGERS